MASPPAALIIRAVSSPPATTMSDTATFAPSLARATAVARPMPDPPPVTNAIFPCTTPAILDLLNERITWKLFSCTCKQRAVKEQQRQCCDLRGALMTRPCQRERRHQTFQRWYPGLRREAGALQEAA